MRELQVAISMLWCLFFTGIMQAMKPEGRVIEYVDPVRARFDIAKINVEHQKIAATQGIMDAAGKPVSYHPQKMDAPIQDYVAAFKAQYPHIPNDMLTTLAMKSIDTNASGAAGPDTLLGKGAKNIFGYNTGYTQVPVKNIIELNPTDTWYNPNSTHLALQNLSSGLKLLNDLYDPKKNPHFTMMRPDYKDATMEVAMSGFIKALHDEHPNVSDVLLATYATVYLQDPQNQTYPKKPNFLGIMIDDKGKPKNFRTTDIVKDPGWPSQEELSVGEQPSLLQKLYATIRAEDVINKTYSMDYKSPGGLDLSQSTIKDASGSAMNLLQAIGVNPPITPEQVQINLKNSDQIKNQYTLNKDEEAAFIALHKDLADLHDLISSLAMNDSMRSPLEQLLQAAQQASDQMNAEIIDKQVVTMLQAANGVALNLQLLQLPQTDLSDPIVKLLRDQYLAANRKAVRLLEAVVGKVEDLQRGRTLENAIKVGKQAQQTVFGDDAIIISEALRLLELKVNITNQAKTIAVQLWSSRDNDPIVVALTNLQNAIENNTTLSQDHKTIINDEIKRLISVYKKAITPDAQNSIVQVSAEQKLDALKKLSNDLSSFYRTKYFDSLDLGLYTQVIEKLQSKIQQMQDCVTALLLKNNNFDENIKAITALQNAIKPDGTNLTTQIDAFNQLMEGDAISKSTMQEDFIALCDQVVKELQARQKEINDSKPAFKAAVNWGNAQNNFQQGNVRAGLADVMQAVPQGAQAVGDSLMVVVGGILAPVGLTFAMLPKPVQQIIIDYVRRYAQIFVTINSNPNFSDDQKKRMQEAVYNGFVCDMQNTIAQKYTGQSFDQLQSGDIQTNAKIGALHQVINYYKPDGIAMSVDIGPKNIDYFEKQLAQANNSSSSNRYTSTSNRSALSLSPPYASSSYSPYSSSPYA